MLLPQSAAPVSAAPISYTESVDLDTKFTTTFTLDVGDNKFSGSLEPTPFPGGRDTWKMVIPANHRISRVRYSRGYLGSATSMTFVFDACWYSTPETTSSSFNQPLTVDGPRDVCILIFSNHNPSVIDWEVTVTVEEIPPNNPPVITVPGPLMTESGVPITFSSSDQISISEPDGDNLEVQLQVTGGTITLSSTSGLDFYRGDGVADQRMQFAGLATAINAALNGAVFTPADGFSGWASILIRVTDDYWLTAISDTISITVFPPSGQPTDNNPPIATNDTYTTNEDTPLTIAAPGVLGNDTDADGDTLTAGLVRGPANGTLTFNADGSFTCTPKANWNGTDSFTYLTYDGTAFSNVATVTITVNAVNDPPVASDDAYTTDEDTLLTITAPGVLSNDADVDGNPLTAVLEIGPANGTLTLNPDGSFTYTPNANWNGTDTFTYHASDGTTTSNVATVTITVNAVNDAPVAADDAYTTDEDTLLTIAAPGVLGNDTDADGNTLTAAPENGPTNGMLTLNANGSFTYTPNANWNGTDTFTYRASDGTDSSNVATVTITVNAVNDAPVAANDAYATDEDVPLTIAAPGVLGNDSDADGNTLTAAPENGPSNGTLTLNANGSFTYTPNADWNGTDTFTYRASDGAAASNVATVTITVGAVNDVPVAVDDAYTTDEDKPLRVPAPGVLGNDSDVEGDALTAALDSGPSHGTVTLNPGGSFEYVPDPGFFGTDTFTYALNDGGAISSVATVTITVGLVNGNTYARDDWDEVSMNGSTLLDVLANDTDPDGDPLHIAQVSQPRYGVATIQGNRIAYTPHPGFVGTDTFTYIAADNFGSQHRATVSVTVWKPVPLCADFDGSTSEVVRATVPDDVVTGGSVFCRILVEHGEFVRPSAEVGRPEVLNLGVLQAVDVFALRHDGTATASFTTGMTVCLQGQGTLLYLDATVAPRAIVPLSAFSRDGYTCASVPNAGTVALVSGTANVTSTVTNSPAPVGASAPLANCMVTTRNILNLRAEPSSAGAVIRTIPYNVTLTAFERAGAWFYVDYLGERGWLSADYVTPQASCGE